MSGIAKAGRKWQKMNDSSYGKLLSNTLVFAIGSFSSKILVLILIPIYTGYLTRAEQGITDVLTQIANWMIPLATMTISEAMIRFGLDKAYDKRRVFTLGNLICGTGMAVFALVLFIVDLTGIADNYIGGYALLLYAYVFMSGMKTLYTTFVRAMEKVKLFALAGIIATVFTLFFIVMFYIVLPPSFLGEGTGIQKYLLATILSDLITTVFVAVAAKLWRFIDFRKIDRELMSTMLQYSMPLIPAQLLWLITNSSDSFMTTHYMGREANGVLAAAYKLPNIVATVYMMFGQAWNMSAITENDSEDRDRFYENVFDFNQSLLYILVGGCMLIIQPLTRLMIGRQVQDCIHYSPMLIYSNVFSCFTTFMGSIYLASRRTKRSLFTSLVSGVINVGLNLILIPTIGLYGPPISTIAAYLTVFIIRAIDSRKLVPFRIDLRKMIVSNAILVVMMGILLMETDLMSKPLLYLAVLLLFCAVFVINLKSITGILRRFLPARIADAVDGLSRIQLIALTGAFALFVVINYLLKLLPLLIIAVAVAFVGLARRDKRIFLAGAAVFSVLLGLIYGWSLLPVGLFIMSALAFIRSPSFSGFFLTALLLDAALGALYRPLLGVFLLLIEILVFAAVFRGVIMEAARDWASRGKKKEARSKTEVRVPRGTRNAE